MSIFIPHRRQSSDKATIWMRKLSWARRSSRVRRAVPFGPQGPRGKQRWCLQAFLSTKALSRPVAFSDDTNEQTPAVSPQAGSSVAAEYKKLSFFPPPPLPPLGLLPRPSKEGRTNIDLGSAAVTDWCYIASCLLRLCLLFTQKARFGGE